MAGRNLIAVRMARWHGGTMAAGGRYQNVSLRYLTANMPPRAFQVTQCYLFEQYGRDCLLHLALP